MGPKRCKKLFFIVVNWHGYGDHIIMKLLEVERKSAGLTQQQLSDLAEVSRKSINAIENGVYVPSTVLALKIAETLGCRVEDLFRLPTR